MKSVEKARTLTPTECAPFSCVIKQFATGEIRVIESPKTSGRFQKQSSAQAQAVPIRYVSDIQTPPHVHKALTAVALGSLDNERKLQEPSLYKNVYKLPGRVKAGHGRLAEKTVFTSRAKRTLREFGTVVDEIYNRKGVFLTLTLPATSDDAYRTMAEYSAYIVERVTQWLRDKMGDVLYAWVWEWQKRGALHLHLVAGCANDTVRGAVVLNWWRFCHDLLSQVSARSGVDLFENRETRINHKNSDNCQFDAQEITKSAARYLAKYLGKRSSKMPGVSWYCPARWWRCSNKALIEIKARRKTIVLRESKPHLLQETIATCLQAIHQPEAESFCYPNRKFPFLLNYLFFYDTIGGAKDAWARLERAVSKMILPTRYHGGGGTKPREAPAIGAGNREGISGAIADFSETCTFMKSILSVSWSTA